MGMGHAANAGYMLPATIENLSKLKADLNEIASWDPDYDNSKKHTNIGVFHKHVEACLKEYAFEGYSVRCIINNKEIAVDLYLYDSSEGSRYDSIEDGIYLWFDEEDIYDKTLSNQGKLLKEMNMLPEYHLWVTFG